MQCNESIYTDDQLTAVIIIFVFATNLTLYYHNSYAACKVVGRP
jgi:hypothetical protein